MRLELSFAFILCFTAFAFAAEVHQEFQVDPGKKLNLDLKTGGKIRIEGWDKAVVSVNGFVKGRDRDNTEVQIEQTPGGIDVRTRFRGGYDHYDASGEFDIRVPYRFDVEIESMGGGVTIHNVEGEFEGSTMGGALNLSGLKGRISLSTMGGGISLTQSHLDGEVSTMGGQVLIEAVTGNVKGSSMGGKVIHKRAGADGKPSGEVNISTMGGELNVDEAPSGAKLNTMGGDIHVGSAKDHVSAKTMGGDVRIDSIDGWVRAETMGGNVKVTMTGDPSKGNRDVELLSMSGDIELTVPSNLPMILDLELAYTKNRSGRYSIKSDFPLKTEETEEWDYEDGSPRKYIYGSGKVGAGTHRVRIRTINGDIILRKS
ncbi:DUF4097 domain-containing protein [bacterium]|nr:DUF4097 domain-containing protein [bacterium]MCI0605948.1 DUF4097 domain-containing protein [bacterium]